MALNENCALTSDVVLFGFKPEKKLAVLLIKRGKEPFKGKWALPGGFIERDEELIDGAKREMKEETNVSLTRINQVGVYSTPSRDPRGRVVSVAYYAIVPRKVVNVKAGDDAHEAKWFSVIKLPELAFDHKDIIFDALAKLKRKMGSQRNAIPLNGIENNSKFSDDIQLMF
ncbi:MAG: NUDIX hydrolase [Schleiferiaceae bacterium]|jgi:8-oxo-dGTP diphosphatase|nr:NUDIX hydrolase [Schleiferiaceae bacterium]